MLTNLVSSTSAHSVLSLTRQFSQTSISSGKKAWKFNEALLRKKANIGRQIRIQDELDKVDPVLGRADTPFIDRIKAAVVEPSSLSYGYERGDVNNLLYGAQRALIAKRPGYSQEQILRTEERRREIVARILDIKNSSSSIQRKLGIKLAREEFARFPGDSGSSEVQAAIMTMKIHYLTAHMKKNKKDFQNIRRLRMLVQQRQAILRYLKRDNPKRYYWAIEKLGLTDHTVTMEFNLDKRYMEKFKVFGDDVLIRESKSVESKKLRAKTKQKKSLRKALNEKAAQEAEELVEEVEVKESSVESPKSSEATV